MKNIVVKNLIKGGFQFRCYGCNQFIYIRDCEIRRKNDSETINCPRCGTLLAQRRIK